MGRQDSFTEHEAVLLLDAYLKTISGEMSRKEAIERCSNDLRHLAAENGAVIDEKFRSLSGVSSQMMRMESAYCGKTVALASTRLFIEIVSIYNSNPEKYERLLIEAKQMMNPKNI